MPDPFQAKLTFDRQMAENFSRGIRQRLGLAIARIAKDLEGQMKNTCPVRTGFLKNSILAKQTDVMQWQVTVGASYGIYVEMGTYKMSAQPFFYPSIDTMEPTFRELIRQVLEMAAREAAE